MRTNAVIIGILGIWLIIAGIIGMGQAANVWNDWIVGVIVAILGFSMVGRATASGVISGILGLWMIASAFIPGVTMAAGARWDDIIVGIILAIVGFSTPSRPAVVTSDIRRAA